MRKTLCTSRKSVWIILSMLLALLVAVGIILVPSRVSGEEVGEISPYTDDSGFIARDNLVYDGTTYEMNELNALLYASGKYITSDMTASIVGYTDPNGVEAEQDDLPEVICDAGAYSIRVADGGDEYTFTINIARAKINLGNYANMSWRLTDVDGVATNSELLNSTGVLLYVYTDSMGKEYPSTSVLSAEQVDELGLTNNYTIRTVLYSVVRNRYKNLTVKVSNNAAYTVEYEADTNTGNTAGRYDAKATLTATKNYTFTLEDATALRGVDIDVSEDKTTAVVTKTWYIVDMNNWLVTEAGDDYSIGDHVFGQKADVAAPKLRYGDDSDISMRLLLNGTQIGTNGFGVADFGRYVNSVMPAGNYELVVTAAGVYSEEVDNVATTDPENPVMVTLYRSGFTESILFTVDKSALPSLDEVNAAIKGRTFTHEWTATSNLYDNSAAAVVDAYLANRTIERDGTVWEDYDAYYCDSYTISFNLASMQSDVYYSATDMTVATSDPDKYIVYYQISAPNYYSSIENLGDNDMRQNYYFEVVNVKAVDVPTVAAKYYNGKVQTADVADGQYYSVTTNNGGSEVGLYNVVFTLRDPECYMWAGQKVDNKIDTVTVKFEIMKSHNEWIVEPDIKSWIAGRFDADDNALIGSAMFGYDNMQILVTDTSEKRTVLFDSTYDDISLLNNLAAGDYYLRLNIAGTDSYNGLTHIMLFTVYKAPGVPGWGIFLIILAILIVIAAVLFVLWKKGVFQILTGKLVIAIRTKATVDATIAAVKANKKAEEAKQKEAEAKHKRQLAERRAKAAAQRALPAEQKAAALEEKARKAAERAEKMKARAEAMQLRAERMKEQAAAEVPAAEPPKTEAPTTEAPVTETPATEAPAAEAAATETPTTK